MIYQKPWVPWWTNPTDPQWNIWEEGKKEIKRKSLDGLAIVGGTLVYHAMQIEAWYLSRYCIIKVIHW